MSVPGGAGPPPVPFWFLRHGETDWNARGLSQGRTDVPLNATGRAQAARAAAALAGRGITAIVASPLVRARDTALAVGEALGLPVAFDPDLREVAFGVQEGRPMSDWYEAWIAGGPPPEGAETFAALRARAVAALGRALARPGPVLVVAHGALFRAVRDACGLSAAVRTPNALPLRLDPPAAPDAPWRITEAPA